MWHACDGNISASMANRGQSYAVIRQVHIRFILIDNLRVDALTPNVMCDDTYSLRITSIKEDAAYSVQGGNEQNAMWWYKFHC